MKKDGTGLKKLADRGGYLGVVERLKHPDFHSESSDVPVWSADGRHVFYTAKVGESIELMRVDLGGKTTQMTKSKPGKRHYHPAASPDGKWLLFGSDRGGTMQPNAASIDGKQSWPITNVPDVSCAMHGNWQPETTRGERWGTGVRSRDFTPERDSHALHPQPLDAASILTVAIQSIHSR